MARYGNSGYGRSSGSKGGYGKSSGGKSGSGGSKGSSKPAMNLTGTYHHQGPRGNDVTSTQKGIIGKISSSTGKSYSGDSKGAYYFIKNNTTKK